MADNPNAKDLNEQRTVKCPNCGAENPAYAIFCPDCGRKISGGEPSMQGTGSEPPQLIPLTPFQPQIPYIQKSHRSRNIIVVVIAAILIVSLTLAAFSMAPTNTLGPTSTPTPTLAPTFTPQATPAPTATATPTPEPVQQSITGVNIQFMYQNSDPNYFGPVSQHFGMTNQPNGILQVTSGQTFWYSFTLTAGTNASPDSVVSITTSTPGFSIVSINPSLPIDFSAGSSIEITVTFQTPQTVFDGDVSVVVTTLGTSS